MNKEVAERIRMLRLSKNLSQENIAHELNISIGAYSNIERGITELTLTRVSEIASILKVDLLDLLNLERNLMFIDENPKDYGFASRKDLEELKALVLQLQQEVKKLSSKP